MRLENDNKRKEDSMHTIRLRKRLTALLGALIVLSLIIIPAANPTTATHQGLYGHQWGN